MPESSELHLQLTPVRCRVAKRIQGLTSELYSGADIISSLARHLCLDGLSIRPLGLDPEQPQPLITEAQLFGFGRPAPSQQTPLELRLLHYGVKPQALLHGSEGELTGWLAWAERRGFTALLCGHQWQPRQDQGKGGYSNLTGDRQPAEAGSGAWRSLLVSADEDRAILGWLCLQFGWDRLLGQLLGYPDCCADAFDQRWPDAVREHQGDLAPLTLAASGAPPFDWRNNVFARYFGAALIQHFPCRFQCSASAATAARAAWALEQFEPEQFAAFRDLLQAPLVYTEKQGVALLRGGQLRQLGGELELDYAAESLLSTEPASPLAQALSQASVVRWSAGQGRFHIGEQAFDGQLAWFQ